MNAEPLPVVIRRSYMATYLPEEGVFIVEPLRFIPLKRMATASPAKKCGL